MKKFIVTLVMATLLLPGNVLAAEKIKLAALGDFPPFQYREKSQMTGIDVDMAREVCKRLGIEPEFKVVPWKRALKIAKKGDVTGILTALHKEERTKFLYYTTEAIHTQKNVIMARKGSGLKVSSLDDLKSKTVGVVRGFSYGQEFDNYQGLKKRVCNNQEDLMRIMNMGRIDVAPGPEKPFLFNSRRFGLQDRFEVVYVITEHPAYTVFSKAIGEKGRVLAEKFDNILKQMKKEGIEQQIIDKYMK